MLVQLENISKSFSGNPVLDRVSLAVEAGQMHALVGENGAGKSTLMKIIMGIEQPDSGRILLKGAEKQWRSPHDAMAEGLAMVHQELSLVPELSVAENLFLGRLPRRAFRVDWQAVQERQEQTFARLGFNIDARRLVRQLSTAEKQMVEIARALTQNAKLIILDEPTSSLAREDVQRLFAVLRAIAADGVGVIYITHLLDEVMALAGTVSVLRDGCVVSSNPVSEVSPQSIVCDMVGRELNEQFPPRGKAKRSAAAPRVLEVRNVSRRGEFDNISFELRQGEILGFAGLVGCGRTELMEAIFGVTPLDSGEMEVSGKAVRIDSPQAALGAGMGLIPDDRKRKGLVLEAGVTFNMSLSAENKFAAGWGWRFKEQEQQATRRLVRDLKIKAAGLRQAVGRLSGGNQQKVVIGKTLNTDADILIFDEPTRGIDVGAKREIYYLLRKLASEGKAILLVSSELEEILGLCDRVLVMHQGHVQGILSAEEATQERIMELAVGMNTVRDE